MLKIIYHQDKGGIWISFMKQDNKVMEDSTKEVEEDSSLTDLRPLSTVPEPHLRLSGYGTLNWSIRAVGTPSRLQFISRNFN